MFAAGLNHTKKTSFAITQHDVSNFSLRWDLQTFRIYYLLLPNQIQLQSDHPGGAMISIGTRPFFIKSISLRLPTRFKVSLLL